MPATINRRPFVAHRHTAVTEIEPGSIAHVPTEGCSVPLRVLVVAVERVDLETAEITGHRHADADREPEAFRVSTRDRYYPVARIVVEGEFTERELEQIADTEAALMSGKVFANIAMGERSRIGYEPPSRSDEYATAVAALAKGIGWDDRQAKICSAAIRALVPNAQTPSQAKSRMTEAMGKELAAGFFDTIGNAGPEAGRRRDHEHDYTLRDRVQAVVTLERARAAYPGGGLPGVGWTIAAIARSLGIDTTVKSS